MLLLHDDIDIDFIHIWSILYMDILLSIEIGLKVRVLLSYNMYVSTWNQYYDLKLLLDQCQVFSMHHTPFYNIFLDDD